MVIADSQIKLAEARMKKRLESGPRAISARYDRRVSRIVVKLDTGVELAIPPHLVQGLANARPEDLTDIEVTPTGLGLHFPKLDADIYVPALLEGVLGSRRWMASIMGQAGGVRTSPAKASAARANGKLGGRPRKVA